MHDDRTLVEGRIRRQLMERVMPAMYSRRVPMTIEAWDVPGEPVTFDVAMAAEYRPFTAGSQWSRPWGTTWFRFTADVPAEWAGQQLEAAIDLGFHQDAAGFQCEGLVFDANGVPLQGVHPRRTGVPLPDQPAGPMVLMLEAASNPAFPSFARSALGDLATAGDKPLYRLRHADLCVRDDTVFHLLLDVEVLFDLMLTLQATDPRRQRLLRQLEAAFDAIDLNSVNATAGAARRLLEPALDVPARGSAHQIVGVGHAHIDSAWLWPIRETIRKCTRTFASATRLMADYPEYRFVCSQAAQYEWMEQRHPVLFERIVAAAKNGQWQPVGGMWVEPDMNLPSGESIVRQLVHGQRYFEQHFGERSTEVWIPDVFGYPASLPQVFALGGCDRFVTQKLSWNKQNRFPHHTFWWEGLDGTRVLTHFPPVDTYNARVSPDEMTHAERNFRDHGWSDWSLMPYGHGNGGGGPTREMVERARRLADLDGSPRLTLGTPAQFFDHVEGEIARGARVPTWRGELYFEMHRGTLTSQTATKMGNRRCERLLREAELWWATGGDLPSDVVLMLDRAWKDVMLQQFHDILPGSSIAWVHDDAEAEHARIAELLEESIAAALRRIAPAGPSIANAASVGRREVIDLDGLPTLVEVPGSSIVAATEVSTDERVVCTEHSMSNGRLAVSWNPHGVITSIIDVERGRQVLPVGEVLGLQIAPDHPVEYDAWDVESWTHAAAQPIGPASAMAMIESGPLRAAVRFTTAVGASTIRTTYSLCVESPRLDIHLDIDWREDERLLSLMVPIDARADDALCDIQFGAVRRPTHASSPWDAAKFEVCAHRYVDVAEPTFGVAVLNNGRYGHSLHDGGVRVSILRAAKYPDPAADHGRHEVTLSVLPHGAGIVDVLAHAEALNMPLRVVTGGTASEAAPAVVQLDNPGVQLSAVKRADDGSGDLIVRLYEACGDRAAVTVQAARPVRSAARCNLLEESIGGIDVADGIVAIILRPYEIVTLRLAG